MDIAFKVYKVWEAGKANQAMGFLETVLGDQKKRQDPKAKKGDPLGAHYCAFCKRGPKERRKDPIGINQCAYCKDSHLRNACLGSKRENRSEKSDRVCPLRKRSTI